MTLILLLLLGGSLAAKLHFVQDEEGLCLDGSKASYYYEKGSGSGEHKFMIYFQGGGWIGGNNLQETLDSALSRSQVFLGSSKGLPIDSVTQGIFDRSQANNPEFYNWHTITINYCDGTGFQGYVKDPVTIKGTKVYFKGERILKSIVEEYMSQLIAAQTVVVSGCSAGGLAALTWLQYIRNTLPKSVEVLGVPDSGIFLDYPTYYGSTTYRNTYQMNFMQIVNVEVDPPNNLCIHENPNEKWKCLFAEHLVKYTHVPIFFIQSLYDSWCLPNVLKLNCGSDGTLRNCDQKQRTFIEGHSVYNQLVMTGRKSDQDGSFSPACLQHCFLYSSQSFNGNTYQVPGSSGITISKALVNWLLYRPGKHQHIDEVQWPLNTACSNLKSLRIRE